MLVVEPSKREEGVAVAPSFVENLETRASQAFGEAWRAGFNIVMMCELTELSDLLASDACFTIGMPTMRSACCVLLAEPTLGPDARACTPACLTSKEGSVVGEEASSSE